MLSDKNIVLGITGGIAAYKAADLASKLTQEGAKVRVVLTDAAARFITPLTLHSLTREPVATDIFQSRHDYGITHINMAATADVVVIAPATANTIAKLAAGIADNLLTCTVLATTSPVVSRNSTRRVFSAATASTRGGPFDLPGAFLPLHPIMPMTVTPQIATANTPLTVIIVFLLPRSYFWRSYQFDLSVCNTSDTYIAACAYTNTACSHFRVFIRIVIVLS